MSSTVVAASLLILSFGECIGSSAHFWCHKTKDGLCETSDEDVFSQDDMRDFVNRTMSSVAAPVNQVADASTIRNKVLAGYQGWDGARSAYDHWSENGKIPGPTNYHFEMVPQMGEYPSGALHDTNFKYNGNGKTVKLYENAADGVVDLHFSWMKDYGLDGVLLQRFISECAKPGKALTQRNKILQQVDSAAAKHGRVYAMMWDMSGGSAHWDTDIKNDWKNYVKKYASSTQYLKENGKPVVCIFGIGLRDRQQAKPSMSLSLIRWLQAEGLYVIGSGPYYWRTDGHDAASGFDKVHAAFDAVMPWAVGRYNTVKDFQSKVPQIKGDAKLTSSRNQGYAPIAYAGYSYHDSNKVNFIKRNAGQFFKAQIDTFLAMQGTTFYYIAMFDEVQEGTAIYKFAANQAESGKGANFVTASIDGVDCPGDLYLKMAGNYATAAKSGSLMHTARINDCPDYIFPGFCSREDIAGGGACVDKDVLDGKTALVRPAQVQCVPTKNGGLNYTCPSGKEMCAQPAPSKAQCSAYPKCAALGLTGDCCPNDKGKVLGCCDQAPIEAKCSAHALCFNRGLKGACCPDSAGHMLDCCKSGPPVAACSANTACAAAGLTGSCCPTTDGKILDCCPKVATPSFIETIV